MPVKDKPIGPLFTRLGIIRLGHKETKMRNGKPVLDKRGKPVQYPVADDYFVLTDAPELVQWYGEQPAELNVFFPFNDVDRNVDDYYRLYSAGSIQCRGNGETMDICVKDAHFVVSGGVCAKAFSENGEEFRPGDIVRCGGPGEAGLYPKCAECEIVSYPKVMIIEAMEAGHFGYYQIGSGSTSKHGRANIRGALEAAREFVRFLTGRPALAGIPMILSLQVESISTPMKKNGKEYRARLPKPILHLVPHPDWVKAQTSAMLESAYLPLARLPAPAAQLPPPPQEAIMYQVQNAYSRSGQDEIEEGEFTEEGSAPGKTPTTPRDAIDKQDGKDVRGAPANTAGTTVGVPGNGPGPDAPDLSGIKTPGDCWRRVLEDLKLYKSDAVEIAGLTDEQLTTLHPADIYAKVWMAIQAGEAPAKSNDDPAIDERRAIVQHAKELAKGWAGPASTDDMQKLIIVLGEIVSKDSDDQKLLLSWLFGYPSQGFSRKDLKGAEVEAVWKHMHLTLNNDNKWVPISNVTAPTYTAMLKQAKLDSGQMEMPL